MGAIISQNYLLIKHRTPHGVGSVIGEQLLARELNRATVNPNNKTAFFYALVYLLYFIQKKMTNQKTLVSQ